MKILSPRKFRSSDCAITKMVVKRTGVVEKHCNTFVRFSNGSCPQTEEIDINEWLKAERIKGGSAKVYNVEIVKIGDPRKFHAVKNCMYHDII